MALCRLVNLTGGRWDLSLDKLNSLHEPSLEICRSVQTPVRINAFVLSRDPRVEELRGLLAGYGATNAQIHHEIVDPEARPALANRLGVRHAGILTVEAGLKIVRTTILDEAHISGAIRKALAPPQRVGITIDNGERIGPPNRASALVSLADALDLENFEPLRFALTGGVPADVDLVMIAGPSRDLSTEAAEHLARYLNQGGRLLITLEVSAEPQPRLESLLANAGIRIQRGIVVDFDHHAKNEPATLVLPILENHPILGTPPPVVLPGSTGVEFLGTDRERFQETVLAVSSQNSYLEVDGLSAPRFTEGRDRPGPITVGLCRARREIPQTRIVVLGNTSFMSDRFLDVLGNRSFLFGCLGWLAGQDQAANVLPRARAHRLLILTRESADLITLVTCVGMPFVAALVACFVMLVRPGKETENS